MITKQEMFNRAVRGLRSQGFERCMSNPGPDLDPEPVYNDGNGRHCAWGWVDRSIGPEAKNNAFFVEDLALEGVGIAKSLTTDLLAFGRNLQWCHDDSPTPAVMERRLRRLGEREGLKWPT